MCYGTYKTHETTKRIQQGNRKMKKVRWGILGTARIGVEKVIPGMQATDSCEIVAIASRELGKAETAAQKLLIPKAYGSYEALLQDDTIDAIYNPLPNHLHVPLSIAALEAGKHVLCEKPIGLSAAEGQLLADAAAKHPHLKVMEAFMYRFHPQWQRAKQIVSRGGIGELRTIQTFFSYFNIKPNDIRNRAEIGGGGLMDIGCYGISVARFIFQREPVRAFGLLDIDPQFGCDRLANVILDFGPARSASFICSTQLSWQQRVNVAGTEGVVEIDLPFNVPPDKAARIRHRRAGQTEEIDLPASDQYGLQGEAFSRAILEDTAVPTPLGDAVANMRVIEAIRASSASGCWANVGE
jgi:predicted dehydrogenase